MERVKAALEPFADTIALLEQEPMSLHTTFRIGGPARYFINVTPETPLGGLLSALHSTGEQITVIGRGSNLLVRDEGIPGVVLCTLGLLLYQWFFRQYQSFYQTLLLLLLQKIPVVFS